MIREWHILASGFTQHNGEPTGMRRLWCDLYAALAAPPCAVILYPWDTDWADVAAYVRGVSAAAPSINLYGYSWGGNGVVQLAEALDREALSVDQMALCDPVWRQGLWSLSWLSLMKDIKLKVPPNVLSVSWCYQRRNTPAGHVPKATSGRTFIGDGILLDRPHEAMDDAPEWHAMAKAVAGVD